MKNSDRRGTLSDRSRKWLNFQHTGPHRCEAKLPSKLKHLQKHRRVWVAGKPRGLCETFILTSQKSGQDKQIASTLQISKPFAFLSTHSSFSESQSALSCVKRSRGPAKVSDSPRKTWENGQNKPQNTSFVFFLQHLVSFNSQLFQIKGTNKHLCLHSSIGKLQDCIEEIEQKPYQLSPLSLEVAPTGCHLFLRNMNKSIIFASPSLRQNHVVLQ